MPACLFFVFRCAAHASAVCLIISPPYAHAIDADISFSPYFL
jgi:hypothetical protein